MTNLAQCSTVVTLVVLGARNRASEWASWLATHSDTVQAESRLRTTVAMAERKERLGSPAEAGEEEEEEEEEEMDSDDSERDGMEVFLWGQRFRGQLPHDQGEAEEAAARAEDGPVRYVRKYFWTHYVDSGFPNRVRHVCPPLPLAVTCHLWAKELAQYLCSS